MRVPLEWLQYKEKRLGQKLIEGDAASLLISSASRKYHGARVIFKGPYCQGLR